MRIGLDIASLACKKKVDQIILIAGDSDFVPAAKLARREGLDFILDPMEATISADLFEHTDGLKSCWKHDHSKIEKGHWIRRKNKKTKTAHGATNTESGTSKVPQQSNQGTFAPFYNITEGHRCARRNLPCADQTEQALSPSCPDSGGGPT